MKIKTGFYTGSSTFNILPKATYSEEDEENLEKLLTELEPTTIEIIPSSSKNFELNEYYKFIDGFVISIIPLLNDFAKSDSSSKDNDIITLTKQFREALHSYLFLTLFINKSNYGIEAFLYTTFSTFQYIISLLIEFTIGKYHSIINFFSDELRSASQENKVLKIELARYTKIVSECPPEILRLMDSIKVAKVKLLESNQKITIEAISKEIGMKRPTFYDKKSKYNIDFDKDTQSFHFITLGITI